MAENIIPVAITPQQKVKTTRTLVERGETLPAGTQGIVVSVDHVHHMLVVGIGDRQFTVAERYLQAV